MSIIEAEKYGVAAKLAGKQSAPALNRDFLEKACATGNSLKLMAAYIHGWTVCHLAEGMPSDAPSVLELKRIANA